MQTTAGKRKFLGSFDEIKLVDDRLVYTFDYSKLPTQIKVDKTLWTVTVSGSRAEYDRENKKYVQIEDIVGEKIRPVLESEGEYLTNIADLIANGKLKASTVDMLYRYFMLTVNGRTTGEEHHTDMLRSPITGELHNASETWAMVLGKKFDYMQSNELPKGVRLNESWLNYAQETIG